MDTRKAKRLIEAIANGDLDKLLTLCSQWKVEPYYRTPDNTDTDIRPDFGVTVRRLAVHVRLSKERE